MRKTLLILAYVCFAIALLMVVAGIDAIGIPGFSLGISDSEMGLIFLFFFPVPLLFGGVLLMVRKWFFKE